MEVNGNFLGDTQHPNSMENRYPEASVIIPMFTFKKMRKIRPNSKQMQHRHATTTATSTTTIVAQKRLPISLFHPPLVYRVQPGYTL